MIESDNERASFHVVTLAFNSSSAKTRGEACEFARKALLDTNRLPGGCTANDSSYFRTLAEACRDLVKLCEATPASAFANGVTAPSGQDEGETMAAEIIEAAKEAVRGVQPWEFTNPERSV